MVKLYLDLCCLKRPFDAQDQPIVRLQTEALLAILALPADIAHFVRSPAQRLENSLDPDPARREAVEVWLAQDLLSAVPEALVQKRMSGLTALGFKAFDAFHLASAELVGADAFLTVDLPLRKLAHRELSQLHVRVTDPVRFLEELSEWTH